MPSINPRSLIEKLNPTCHRALDAAAGLCLSHTHFSIEIEHWFIKLCDGAGGDFAAIFRHYQIDPSKVKQELEATIRRFKTGNGRAPSLSVEVFDLVREAWVLASLEYGSPQIRSAHLLVAALTERSLALHMKSSSLELGRIPADRLLNDLKSILEIASTEENAHEAAA
ncbi:MAG TPA: Clp protease N-terminal domain-containing protein, partial [Urbifossiella sp.]